MDGNGLFPSAKLRTVCGLASMDFDQMRENIITRLRSLLPETVVYHDVPHTLNVEKAATRYAKLEGVDSESILLLRTATLFHDAGYIYSNKNNEDFGINMAKSMLPNFGYSDIQIEIIEKIINSTKRSVEPTSLMEMIMCDADHDYLGRPDYYAIANKLRQEYENEDRTMTDKEWIEFQLHFLENVHVYYTQTAKNIRDIGKSARIRELNVKLKQLEESEE